MSTKLPYRVQYDYMERYSANFGSWAEALAFARNLRDIYKAKKMKNLTVSIYNENLCDENSYGLTEEQQEEWE